MKSESECDLSMKALYVCQDEEHIKVQYLEGVREENISLKPRREMGFWLL